MSLRPARRPPLALLVPAVGAVLFVALPLAGLVQRAPWSATWHQARSPAVRTALRLSLECSTVALLIGLVLGVPLAWILARVPFPGRALVRGLVTLPMVLPPVVGGVALLLAFGRRGLAGRLLAQAFGIHLPFTTAGTVVAEAFVAFPFVVVTVEAGFRQLDRRYEEAAATLGAGPWRTLWRVTLPMAAPSLTAGGALAWARALGEFGATITFAGNLGGRTQTMPLAVYQTLATDPDGAVVLSLVLLAVSLAVLVALRGRWLAGG